MPLLDRVLTQTRPPWVRGVILALFGIVARLPSLQGELVWDDVSLVRDNPFVKSPLLFLETFRHYLTLDGSSAHYRPIQNISYFFDYLIWNADPFGYHLSNLLWHGGAGILLYFLLLRLLGPFRQCFADKPALLSNVAFFIALFWVVHPVHSAAVDYISGRADSLAFVFACGAWLIYFKARSVAARGARFSLNGIAAMLALASLCARETGCVWMLLFLCHLFFFDREASRRFKMIVAAVCLCLVAVYAGLRQLPAEVLLARPGDQLPVSERASLMLRALGDYSRLMVYPANLHIERSVRASADEPGAFLLIFGAVTAAILAYGASRKGKARSIRLLGLAWFILGYLPVSNLFPLNATVAEHWLYLPSVGLLIFVAGLVLEWPRRHPAFLAGIGVIALFALSGRSFIRSGDWLDSTTLYRRSLAEGAAKTRVMLNLAQTYAGQKEFAKAEALLRLLVESNPNYAMAQNALGHLLLQRGKTDQAQRIFSQAADQSTPAATDQPRTWIAALNLAYIKYSRKELPAALAILEKARADYPGTWRLIGLESEILRGNGQGEKALALVQQFRKANWWHCPAAIEAGRIHLEQHRFAQAEKELRHATWLDIHDAESLNLLAALRITQNQLEAACEIQRRAVRRQPEQPQQYFLLSDILKKLGRHDEAHAALARFHSLQALAKTHSKLSAPN